MSDKNEYKKGSVNEFSDNWSKRDETKYFHFAKDKPVNQIQLAFTQNYHLFKEILRKKDQGKVLVVGCGRGSLSAYFANDGWECSLIDLSKEAIDRAKEAFQERNLTAKFDVGDAMSLPYESNFFDLTFSIGLLEHFEDVKQVIAEQYRVLKPGGCFIGYVVPEFKNNIQKEYEWINMLLAKHLSISSSEEKQDVFRSDNLSDYYLPILSDVGFKNADAIGCYPLPMISYSPSFPFTLLSDDAELHLVDYFTKTLNSRKSKNSSQNPWTCDEDFGQAFVISGFK